MQQLGRELGCSFWWMESAKAVTAPEDLAKIGYRMGVPMGGDLITPNKKRSPEFIVRAVKDPLGANLDRVQIVKGWVDKQGALMKKYTILHGQEIVL